MANKLPNEDELFHQLTVEKASISEDMWGLIYSSVEDSILIIKLLITLYHEQDKDIPAEEARKIMGHIGDVSIVFRKIINPRVIKTEDKGFVRIKNESQQLHPIIKEMFSHYIGNDIQSLNFMIGDYVDDGKALDKDVCGRILVRIEEMENFLSNLKTRTETIEERIRNQLTTPLVYLNNLKKGLNEADQKRVEKCITSLLEIHKILESRDHYRF